MLETKMVFDWTLDYTYIEIISGSFMSLGQGFRSQSVADTNNCKTNAAEYKGTFKGRNSQRCPGIEELHQGSHSL